MSASVISAPLPLTEDRPEVGLVDCDVHPVLPQRLLLERLDDRWSELLARYGARMPNAITTEHYPRTRNRGMREDAWPADGGFPGSDPELAQRQLLDEFGVDYAVLNALHMTDNYEVPELAAAQARSLNDWLFEEWISRDSRFVGSIMISHEHPDLAVREIERRARQHGWVQVLMPGGAQAAHGHDRYWPIYRAAVEHGLPVAFHTGGYRSYRGSGWPSYYFEEHVSNSVVMHGMLMSMVCQGLFDVLPELQVVLTEGGVAWMAPALWAARDAWPLIGDSAPHLQRSMADILHRNVWFTTQPIEEPDDGAELVDMLADAGLFDRLLFSTDYPHWDFDSPTRALPRQIDKELRADILAGNAARLYGLRGRPDIGTGEVSGSTAPGWQDAPEAEPLESGDCLPERPRTPREGR